MASVTVSGVSKRFGVLHVLRDIDIAAEDGEFIVLVGPSGCGKSTLLRMIAGLETASEGEIFIGPKAVNGIPSKDRDIAMVFQNYALYPHMTVRENMAFSLRLRRAPRDEVASRVVKAAGMLGLDGLLDRFPRQLSGGQRQRVAMGRAIVRDPQLFLFDEPLSNLDAKLRVAMRAEIKELHQRLGTTTIYVTHDQIEAMTLADRIVVMRDGVVEQIGAPQQLYDQPRNLFVAGFIGSPAMNFVPGFVRAEEGAWLETKDGLRLSLSDSERVHAGREVVAGVRPEAMEITEQGLPADVVIVEPTGPELLIRLHLGESEVTIACRTERSFHPSEQIKISVAPNRIHLFDQNTGERV